MKAFQIVDKWGYENLGLVEIPKPQARAGHVIIKVKSVSLNYRDHLVIQGHYNPKYPLSLVPCSDMSGEIESIGDGVTQWKAGDRVTNICALNWMDGQMSRDVLKNTMGGPLPGTLQQYIQLPEHALMPVPEHLDFDQACTLPCAALTAYSALLTHGNLVAGQKVLVLGTGGVSIFALQLAKLHGAYVIVTSSSDEKLSKVKKMGADETINYRTYPDWEKQVYEITNGVGVDHIIEVGGAGTLEKSLKSVRPGGHVHLIGVLAGVAKDMNLLPVLMHNIQLQGIFVGHKAAFSAMNRAIELHKIYPVIDRVFEFGKARDALDHLSSGRHFGKVVIQVDHQVDQ